MLTSTPELLKCPGSRGKCGAPLALKATHESPTASGEVREVSAGSLFCRKCGGKYPILAGVAIVVPDVGGYLVEHVKGIARRVPESEIPPEYRAAFAQARREIRSEHIEEDLEAERVNALYVMTHYLRAGADAWWTGANGDASPAIEKLIRDHWNQGPFAALSELVTSAGSLVELGCGSGGFYAALRDRLTAYLGVDSSFEAIALARHFALGARLRGKLLFPSDLLDGPVSRALEIPVPAAINGRADFVVGDVEHPPLLPGRWDFTAALNLIDMLHEPARLPELQKSLLRPGGTALQSAPYIWHGEIARKLRARLPKEQPRDSAAAVEWLYRERGFKIGASRRHVPWLFFKHARQIELYSVHLFAATAEA
jgi:SAM-dependent methyltransferase/uncharacterized protein YbaR (Trm112 family)